jgi:hypothetical protein
MVTSFHIPLTTAPTPHERPNKLASPHKPLATVHTSLTCRPPTLVPDTSTPADPGEGGAGRQGRRSGSNPGWEELHGVAWMKQIFRRSFNSMQDSQITQEKLQDSRIIQGSNEKSELLRHVFSVCHKSKEVVQKPCEI